STPDTQTRTFIVKTKTLSANILHNNKHRYTPLSYLPNSTTFTLPQHEHYTDNIPPYTPHHQPTPPHQIPTHPQTNIEHYPYTSL
ncbi:MAG: hypothetical protein LBE76_00180, partial [Nitrososphaerota archaeon]|nr:hypothetical protein [Nitrososphaerota archaeon]